MQLRAIALSAIALLLSVTAGPGQQAAAITTDQQAIQKSPGNTSETVLELAQKCLRLYLSLPKASEGGTPSESDVRAASEMCRRAIEASGLSSGDFWAKYRPLIDASTTRPEPVRNATLEELIRECVARVARGAKIATNDQPTDETRAICQRAIEATGLSTADFWAKYGPATPQGPDASPLRLVTLCVQLAAELTADSTQEQAKAAGDACRKALGR